ncbi:hypothetical protein SAMN04487825_107104 [Prevotella sp. kh1p2]|nr:hypothetical protein SAMN04487825_107104 [Prevotella sp. kh1p2]SNU11600.1 hypothetical protein SAMN06298210_11221 [Prevotellaceae bacterium KH2P17]
MTACLSTRMTDCRRVTRRAILIGILALLGCRALAQQRRLQIVVVDTELQPVTGVAVRVDNCGHRQSGLTDTEGRFRCQLAEADSCTEAEVSVQSNLYEPLDTLISTAAEGEQVLTMRHLSIGEVKVIGFRKLARSNAERTVFALDTRGLPATAKLDLALRRLPGVIYGDTGFKLLGNDKPAKLLLDGIEISQEEIAKVDATEIERVEIRRVGVNEDTYAGEINFIRKKDHTRLFKGEAELSTQLTRPGSFVMPNVSYHSEKVDITSWVSHTYSRQHSDRSTFRDGALTFRSHDKTNLNQYAASTRVNLFFSSRWMAFLSYSMFGYNAHTNSYLPITNVGASNQHTREKYFSHFGNAVARYNPGKNNRLFGKARYLNYLNTNEVTTPSAYTYRGGLHEWTGEIVDEADSLHTGRIFHNVIAGYKSIFRQSLLTASKERYNSDVQQLYVKDQFDLGTHLGAFVILKGE